MLRGNHMTKQKADWLRTGDDIRLRMTQGHSHASLLLCCSAPYYTAAVITMREEMEGGGRMVEWGWQGGAAVWRSRRARKLLNRQQRYRGWGREREGGYPQDVSAGSWGGRGGLPDWMGQVMPWWSMGQVLGFSHCRESAFVLLFPSVFLCGWSAFVYLTSSCAYSTSRCLSLFLLTPLLPVFVSLLLYHTF